MERSVVVSRGCRPADGLPQSAKRRFWSVATLGAYILCIALPLTYNAVRVPRVALPHIEIDDLSAATAEPLATALPSTITAYLVCPGHGYSCLEHQQLSPYAEQLGLAVLEEAGLNPEQAPLIVRVLLDAPGRCSASSWISPGEANRRTTNMRRSAAATSSSSSSSGGGGGGDGGSSCLDLVTSPDLHRVVTGGSDRDFDDWAAARLAGQDRPGNYHIFVVPDPWLAATEPPYGSVGRRRMAFVRHPAGHVPTHGSVVRLVALLAAPAFATELGVPSAADSRGAGPDREADPDAGQPLPMSAAAQLHLSFSLCNAHPSPDGDHDHDHDDGDDVSGGGAGDAPASSAFTWRFSEFEAQFVTPLKQVLSLAVRVTVSSQVLYFTPGRVNGTWDARHRAFVLPYNQLPFFVDSSWPLDPGRTGLPASASGGGGGGDGDAPYDIVPVAAGSRRVAVGEVITMPLPATGAAGRTAGEAAAAASLPHLLPPEAAAALPPAVLHFVLYAPPPRQRPLVLLGPDDAPAPANSFRVPGWGMLQVLNQVPESGLILAPVGPEALQGFAIELVSQLRALLGLGAARRRLLRLVQASVNSSATAPGTSAPDSAIGRVSLLSALRTGLAPWEVDALVRRRVREDAAGATSTLAALTRLVRQVPTMAVPGHVGTRVRNAVAALQRVLQFAAQGRYEAASRAAQEARSWAEAAFSDPALSSRLNVPDAHLVGVYLPFCLPAALPLLQMLFQEVWKRRGKRRVAVAAVAAMVQARGGTCVGHQAAAEGPGMAVAGSEAEMAATAPVKGNVDEGT